MEDAIHEKDKIIYGPKVVVPKVKGIGTALYEKMLEHQDVIGQIDGVTEEKDTYGQLLERCVRAAHRLQEKGIGQEDITASCCLNHLNTFVPMIASFFIGAIPAALHPDLNLQDTINLIKQVRPKIFFVDPEAVGLIRDALARAEIEAEIVIFGRGFEQEFLIPFPGEKDFHPIEIKDVKATALISFSSGTTGLAKGVCLNHLGLIGLRDPTINPYNVFDELIILGFTPLFWISSTLIFLLCLYNKYTRLVFPKYNPDTLWEILEKFQVNGLFMQPNLLLSLCKKGRPEIVDTSNLLYAFVAGSTVSKEEVSQIQQVMQTTVANGYALTEFGGAGLALNSLQNEKDLEILQERPHTLGRPLNGFAYKVVDLETEQRLGANRPGELRIKTEFQMNGYYKMESGYAWDSEGFIRTGDIVYYDEDYSFYFVERYKEVIKVQSWHVTPAKLESLLVSYPGVCDAAVIGVPDEVYGEVPMGIVVLDESVAETTTPEDVEMFVDEIVDDKHKLRGGVRFVKTLPRTPTGKLLRREVKRLVLEG